MSFEEALNADFVDLLRSLAAEKVEFMIVGAHAMGAHGLPRATGDMDVFVRATPENALLVHRALLRFGAPLSAHGVTAELFAQPGNVYQLGLPPRRIDILTSIDGIEFAAAAPDALIVEVAGMGVPFLGREALLINKRAAGRDKDLLDVKLLEKK